MQSRATLVLLLLSVSVESGLGHKSILWEKISQVLTSSGAHKGDARSHHTEHAIKEENLKDVVNFRVHHPTPYSQGVDVARTSEDRGGQNKWNGHGVEQGVKVAPQLHDTGSQIYWSSGGQEGKQYWKYEGSQWTKNENKWKTEEYNDKQPNWKYEGETKIEEQSGNTEQKWKAIQSQNEHGRPYWKEVTGSKEEEKPEWILVWPQWTKDEQNWETREQEKDKGELTQRWRIDEQKKSEGNWRTKEETLKFEIPRWKESEGKWKVESPQGEEEQKWKIDDSQWKLVTKEQAEQQIKNTNENFKKEERWKNEEKEKAGLFEKEENSKGDEKNVDSWNSKEKDIWRQIYEELERKKLDDKREYEINAPKPKENINNTQYQNIWKMLYDEAEKKKNQEEESIEEKKGQFAILAEEEIKRHEKEIWRKFYADIERKRQEENIKWEHAGEEFRRTHEVSGQYSNTNDQDEIWKRIFEEVQKKKEEESKKIIEWKEDEIKMIYDTWKKICEAREKKKIEELESSEKSNKQGTSFSLNKDEYRDANPEYREDANEKSAPHSPHSEKVEWHVALEHREPEYKYYAHSDPQGSAQVFVYPSGANSEAVEEPLKQWKAESESHLSTEERGSQWKTYFVPVDTRGSVLPQDIVWKTSEGRSEAGAELRETGANNPEAAGKTQTGPAEWATPINAQAAPASFQHIVWHTPQKEFAYPVSEG